jgi:hypothetical protein
MLEIEDEIDDCIKWAGEALHNPRYSRRHRFIKCRSYLDDAMGILEDGLDIMDEMNISEDDWRDDR